MKYYGGKWARNCHPDDLWVTYFTSSKIVNKYIEQNGDPDVIQIRKIFGENQTACYSWETRVLNKLDVRSREDYLNKHNNDGRVPTCWESQEFRLKRSKCSSESNKKRILEGTHPFAGVLGTANAIKRNKTMVENGTHHFLGSKFQQDRVARGVHQFSGEKGSLFAKERNSKLLSEGRHHSQIDMICDVCNLKVKGPSGLSSHKRHKHPSLVTMKIL
jgi:hypothetical protein